MVLLLLWQKSVLMVLPVLVQQLGLRTGAWLTWLWLLPSLPPWHLPLLRLLPQTQLLTHSLHPLPPASG